MKTIVLLFHPDIQNSRINKRLIQELDSSLAVHHVDEVYPNEQIDVIQEQLLIEQYDRIIFQFPLYWYSSPPLLKKWLDKVLTYGWAYGSTGKKLYGKELLLVVTAGDAEENFHTTGAVGFPLENLLQPFEATCRMIGMTYLPPFLRYSVNRLTDDQLTQCAKAYQAYIVRELE